MTEIAYALYRFLSGAIGAYAVIDATKSSVKTIRDELFLRKVLAFLEICEKLSATQRDHLLLEIQHSYNEKKLGEILITYLDRVETTKSAEYIARCFHELAKGRISVDEFWLVLYAFSTLPSFALATLKPYGSNGLLTAKYLELFSASGLAYITGGPISDPTRVSLIQEPCKIIYSILNDESVKSIP